MSEEKEKVLYKSMYEYCKDHNIAHLENTKLEEGDKYIIFHFRPIDQPDFDCDLHKAITSDEGKRYIYVNWKWGEDIEEEEENYLLEDSILDEVFAVYFWNEEKEIYQCLGSVYQNEEGARKQVEDNKRADIEDNK